ncbi:MAG: DUF494 family protein [Calditrichaceae bacterium]|jgi:uncharacterized protein Smg (DUF494 family)
MQERIVEIIIYLLEEFRHQQSEETYHDLSNELISRGYTEHEINYAFSWVFNHLQNKSTGTQEQFNYSENSNRILHDVERMVISTDAYGYLLQLRYLGLISDNELENIIDRLLSLGTSSVSLDDVKSITASMLLGSDSNNTWDGVFFHPGTNTIH